ncbi:hypothetical protein WJX74_000592 [Apatococcus lobatus]|uniref:SnoaL-like domain-containing protein n=2 Tax=Apatococcus TaxID=904362 RepID=A0AAW1SUS7_9CHLO
MANFYSPTEEGWLKKAKALDEQLVRQQDLKVIDLNTASDVVLHADQITLDEDIKGQEALKEYYSKYFEKYDYKHRFLTSALCAKSNSVFVLSIDENITPKPNAFPSQKSAPSTSYAVWKYDFGEDHLVHGIWFLRQLSKDEIGRKLVTEVDYESDSITPWDLRAKGPSSNVPLVMKVMESASTYSSIWETGNLEKTDDIMVKDMTEVNMIFGGKKTGRDKFKAMIQGVYTSWKPSKTYHELGVTTDGDKVFLFWKQEGEQTDKGIGSSIYGLNLFTCNEEGKITEILGFRQPLTSERSKLLKNP